MRLSESAVSVRHLSFIETGRANPSRAMLMRLSEVLAYPDVPPALRALDPTPPTVRVVPIRYVRDDRRFDYFSMVTTLGTAQDVTLQELRIECFFPANEATRSEARRLRP
jgi:transcriptional regulator with XRE-family HTH domain